MLLELQRLAIDRDHHTEVLKYTRRIESMIDTSKVLKSQLLDSQIYLDIVTQPVVVDRNMVNKDGSYRINELQEIVIGLIILLKDSAIRESNSSSPLTEFTWTKHQYNLVFVNVINTLLPTYATIQNALFDDY